MKSRSQVCAISIAGRRSDVGCSDENFDLKHSRPYLLSTVYTAREDNSSLFLITTRAASWLDGAHVVFGTCGWGSQQGIAHCLLQVMSAKVFPL
jgi:cyclophilin family peptidyl-prolyl cis-trans isomerase